MLTHTTGEKIAYEKRAISSLKLKLISFRVPPFWKHFLPPLIGIFEGERKRSLFQGIKPFKDALANKAKIREHGSDVFPIKAFSSFPFFSPTVDVLSLLWAGLH